PVLLLGGTKNDNLFQIPDLEEHLDELHSIGGNFIRNTMSFRDSGDAFPFFRTPEGKYDLDKWNEKYWEKFEHLLKFTNERDIIIQIEVWDRFDYSTKYWAFNPWNPENNINYTEEESGLEEEYPMHPARDLQPFFHTINTLPRYEERLVLIKKYQDKVIDKMLSYSLSYGNVLYCMDNETSTPSEWGKYWISYISDKALKKGVQIYLTDMFDHFFKPQECESCLKAIEQPDIYTFIDISQINSRNFDEKHWDVLQWIMGRMKDYLRPVNNTKVYGGGNTGFGSGELKDGVERFCRNIIGGCASARFHRPPTGNGLNHNTKGTIKAFRKLETLVKMWDVEVHMELLSERDSDEAYLRAEPGEKYVLYFTDGGSVGLDLTKETGKDFKVKWINIQTGEWESEDSITGGDIVAVTAPADGGWFAVIVR
ncbi:putative collagen-binding domain-containing protein, partial [candidate division KSB1 bacterium]